MAMNTIRIKKRPARGIAIWLALVLLAIAVTATFKAAGVHSPVQLQLGSAPPARLTAPLRVALSNIEPGTWRLDNKHGLGNCSLNGQRVPGTVLPMLYEAGLIPDPLHRFGEQDLLWVAMDNWTFSLDFEPPAGLLQEPSVLLHFGGLDTVAEITLNGAAVGRTVNAHRPHAFNVTQLLTSGHNKLSVTLLSGPAYAHAQLKAYPYEMPSNPVDRSIGAYNMIRKAASDFGWDWGPAFAPAGITGPIELWGHSTALLRGVAVRQRHLANGSVELEADGLLLPPPVLSPAEHGSAAQQSEQGELLLELTSADGSRVFRARADISTPALGAPPSSRPYLWADNNEPEDAAGGGQGARHGAPVAGEPVRHSLKVLVDKPELWWPFDFGAQTLYALKLTYTPVGRLGSHGLSGLASGSGKPASRGQSVSRRVGLRLVELVTDPMPGGGETFFFRVNGLPLWARGANIVPAHVFETSESPAQLRRLVRDAKASHMNMLRVWGGGRYFADAFYDACDEEGVLVWQEAMFACAVYPADSAFLKEVWLEVSHQAARLSSHPSIALWGGNNENEQAFGWYHQVSSQIGIYSIDYNKLFVDVIGRAVLLTDPNMTYLDTSPTKGLVSRNPYTKRWGNTHDTSRGDIHLYDYFADLFLNASYPHARFVSEFGFMSLPSFAAYKHVTEPEDWVVEGPMTLFRLRHPGGIGEMSNQMGKHFLQQPLGQAQGGEQAAAGEGQDQQAARTFASYTYLSQLQQGMAYQTAAQQWRRNRADINARTMGLLYWQFNDIWQGPSWSGVNSDGSWRLLHHLATEFFRPVMVSGVRGGNEVLEVHLTNDLPVTVKGTLSVDAIPFKATSPDHIVSVHSSADAAVPALDSKLAWSTGLGADFLKSVAEKMADKPASLAAQDIFLRLRFCPKVVHPQHSPGGHDKRHPAPNPFLASEAYREGEGGSSSACQSPVALPAGASEAQCAAARHLLRCSEALVFLTEFKDAGMQPAKVVAAVVPAGGGGNSGKADSGSGPLGELLGPAPSFGVKLSSDAVALFVSVENEQQPGRFNGGGLLLLPWEPQTLGFYPSEDAAAGSSGSGSKDAAGGGGGAPPADKLAVYWLQQELAVLAGKPADKPA